MDTKELNQTVLALTYPRYGDVYKGKKINTTEDFVAARAIYRAEVGQLEDQWEPWLGQEYASALPEKVRAILFARAWELGHHNGYSEVEHHYEELADFTLSVYGLKA